MTDKEKKVVHKIRLLFRNLIKLFNVKKLGGGGGGGDMDFPPRRHLYPTLNPGYF